MFELRAEQIASITILAIGLAVCASAAPVEPLEVELSVQGAPVEAEGCTGGDWSLSWRGQVPGEGGPIDDILISYSSFDTTHKEDRQGPPVSLTVKPVTCKDDQGNVAVSASIAGGDRLVRGVIALKNDPAVKAPFFTFDVSDAGTCSINYAGAMRQEFTEFLISLRSSDLMGMSPALRVDRTEMRDGFEKHFKLSGQIIPLSPFCIGHKIVRGDLTLRYKRRDELPRLSLAGCANLSKGGATTIQANASPAGGDLTFESAPPELLSIQPQTSAARITGANPGRGQLKASYSLNGKTAAANLPASTVELVSINDGQPSQPMGLYGIDAKLSSKVYAIPIQTHPVDAGDLLIFVAQNDAIVSVNTNRNSIAIQPVREGRTIISAKTLCGEPVGPPIEIEIRTCDDEVHAELKRRQEVAMHREREIVKRITTLTADSEFQRAGKEVAEHTANMAVKTAEVIAATLTGAQAAAVRNGTATAVSLRNIEMAQNVWDTSNVIKDANAGNINSSLLGAAVVTAGKWTLSSLKGLIDAGLAAQDLGQDLGTLIGFTEQLEQLTAQHDEARREVHEITRRLHLCEKLPPPPPLPPKKDKPQPPPTHTEEPPPVDIPVEELPTEQPEEEGEQPPQPPPAPPDPPRNPGSAGLCVRPVEEPLGSDDLQDVLATVNQFKTASQRAREAFEAFRASLQPVQQSLALDQNAQIATVKSMAGPFDAMVEQLFSMADVARAQEKRFELCTEKLPTQLERIEATLPISTAQ